MTRVLLFPLVELRSGQSLAEILEQIKLQISDQDSLLTRIVDHLQRWQMTDDDSVIVDFPEPDAQCALDILDEVRSVDLC